MTYNNAGGYKAYQNASTTIDKGAQLILLYDSAIKFLQQSKESAENKDFKKTYELIDRSCSIINGLDSCLDFSIDEEIAGILDEYYRSLDRRMVMFECNYDLALCDDIVEDLKLVRDTWKEVLQEHKPTGN